MCSLYMHMLHLFLVEAFISSLLNTRRFVLMCSVEVKGTVLRVVAWSVGVLPAVVIPFVDGGRLTGFVGCLSILNSVEEIVVVAKDEVPKMNIRTIGEFNIFKRQLKSFYFINAFM